ncbi:MAG TPA: sigma-70 family RNA polymerase sigma factor [bacterium]|nr:sigma-70 family RNA polymerase sigma factor [bacterium]
MGGRTVGGGSAVILKMTHDEFTATVEGHRREIQLHCYRMLGSLVDAEDLTQETLLRAWRRRETYAGRGSIRAWLYKIATHICLDELGRRPRRLLPQQLLPPADPSVPPAPPATEPVWLEPYPDHLLPDPMADPAARVDVQESVRLAFLTALQMLPPRQRAVLILRDVLGFDARETAGLLEFTVSAVNSLLHRARATMTKRYHPQETPPDDRVQELLRRYVSAWESANVEGLIALLREDARFAMPPSPAWYSGRDAIAAFATASVFSGPGRWRMRRTRANAQPALAVYVAEAGGLPRAAGIQVLMFEGDRIAEATTFMDPALFPRFNLPETLAPAGA